MANPRLRQYPAGGSITIANGVEFPIERGGSFIRVRTASTGFTLRINDEEELNVTENDVFRFQDAPFGRLVVVNDSGGNLTFQLEIGDGSVETNNVAISGDIDLSKSATIDTIDDVTLTAATATQIAAADSNRREILITNMTGDVIRIGDSGVGASSGVRVADGASVTLATTAAVYSYSVAGGDVSVTVIED